MAKETLKYKKGVAKNLLDLCVGSDLEKQRLAHRDSCSIEGVVIDGDGVEQEAGKWLKSNKKNLKD